MSDLILGQAQQLISTNWPVVWIAGIGLLVTLLTPVAVTIFGMATTRQVDCNTKVLREVHDITNSNYKKLEDRIEDLLTERDDRLHENATTILKLKEEIVELKSKLKLN